MPIRLAWAALTLAACSRGAESIPIAPAPSDCRSQEVERALQREPSAGVIVLLNDSADVRARQDQVLGDLGAEFQLERRYESIPGMSGRITRAGYVRAQQHADVRCVQFDGPGSGG